MPVDVNAVATGQQYGYLGDATGGAQTITNLGQFNGGVRPGVYATSTAGGNITVTNGAAAGAGQGARITGAANPNANAVQLGALTTNIAGGANGLIVTTNYGTTSGAYTGGVFGTNAYGIYGRNLSTSISLLTENVIINNYGTVSATGTVASTGDRRTNPRPSVHGFSV